MFIANNGQNLRFSLIWSTYRREKVGFMRCLIGRRDVLVAIVASASTFLSMYLARPEPRTRFVAANSYLMPSAPLDRLVDQLNFKDTPFREAIDTLSRKTGMTTRLHTWSLASAGINADDPVSLHVANMIAGQVLDQMIACLGSGPRPAYWKSDGILEVGTAAEKDRAIITRLYDVRDILKSEVERPRALFPSATETSLDDAQNALIKYPEDYVVTESWKDNGGTSGVLYCAFGRLVVTQTPRNQDAVELALYYISDRLAAKLPLDGVALPTQ